MRDPRNHDRRASAISGLVVVLAILIFARGTRLVGAYADRFRAVHGYGVSVAFVAALAGAIGLLFLGIWKRPKATAAVGGLAALALIVTSGNAWAFLIASALLGLTVLAGDAISRLLRGREPQEGELAVSAAAGCIGVGAILLVLGEIRLVRPLPLAAIAVSLFFARRHRVRELWRGIVDALAKLEEDSRSAASAIWLVIAVTAVVTGFLGSLRPEVSFDALAYHLPEVRDFAARGRVEPFGSITETLLWHNYETFLGVGFLAGGERVVRFLHFGMGLAAFGAAIALGRRLGGSRSGPLIALALAALPAVSAQLKQTYVDLPAALCVTAAALEVAESGRERRRLWLGGFLFGGALATKIFAAWAVGALLILLVVVRRRSPRDLLAFGLGALLPLLPWFFWSQSREGFFLSPYSDPLARGLEAIPSRPATDSPPSGIWGLLRLPYDRTFHVVRLLRTGDGFAGFLPLLLLPGTLGWGRRKFLLFCAAALTAILPWYLLSSSGVLTPSIRFLIPVYPLYAIFTALGLARLTQGFRGGWGQAAAISLSAVSLLLPAHLFSLPFDAKVAVGRVSREESLSAYLPAYPLWRYVSPQDRVLLLGEWDRFHCPAEFVLREIQLQIPAGEWKNAGSEIRRLGFTHIVHRLDQQPRKELRESLGSCLQVVARHESAALYRVDWGNADCSPPISDGTSSPKDPRRMD